MLSVTESGHGSMVKSRRIGATVVSGQTERLWPYTNITAGVLVMNGGRMGNLSNTITFETPEGGKQSMNNQWGNESTNCWIKTIQVQFPWEVQMRLTGSNLPYPYYTVTNTKASNINSSIHNPNSDSGSNYNAHTNSNYLVTNSLMLATGYSSNPSSTSFLQLL